MLPKSISQLFDELSVVNLKIYIAVDILEKCEGPAELLAEIGKKAQTLNKQRNLLKNAIETMLGKSLDDLDIKL